VHLISSREAFSKDIKSTQALHNHSGKPEITVVNIHKFKDDPHVISTNDYNVNIQRVYFLDEVHRSYDPKGSFLANLEESDRLAIKIGLTGTPLIGSFSKKDDTAEQKNNQIQALMMLQNYISDLTKSEKLTKNNIKDAKEEQKKIYKEINSIKHGLNSIIGNTDYVNSILKEKTQNEI
jgi:type I site-specific restriction-modification system R (restriction) subunit